MLVKNRKIKEEKLDFVLSQDLEIKFELLQNQIKLSQLLIENILETEVQQLSGLKYSHDKPNEGRYSRWGTNEGSVLIGEEKVRIKVPRVIDKEVEKNVSLNNYKLLKKLPTPSEELIDGKSLAKQRIIIALGVTMEGEKIALGFIQSSSENSRSIKQFLKGLIARGLNYKKGILCVTDGSKGIKNEINWKVIKLIK